jgi:hypothetical protein
MFICSAAFGQKQILINLRVADNIVKTDEIRVIIKNLADTISQIAFKQVRQGTQTQMSVINGLGVYSITFKFLIKNKWRKTDYEFSVGGNEKRIEIYFDFDRNDRGKEYLKDLTVSKVYASSNLSIVPVWGLKRGKQPVYKIFSQSDTTFYGQSMTNHFFGKLLYRASDSTWKSIYGSYCTSTESEKPLTKGKSVFSCIPSYNPGDEFVVRLPGQYKYIVALGTQKYESGILTSLIKSAKTRKRVLTHFELESSFTID